jgi:hypothetical protein
MQNRYMEIGQVRFESGRQLSLDGTVCFYYSKAASSMLQKEHVAYT